MARFELRLQRMLRKFGRIVVEWKLNRLEPKDRADMPPRLRWEGCDYSPKRLSPMRNTHCLFGPICVHRWLYQSLEGLKLASLFPLEHCLGIVAGVATPALAQFAARLSVDYTQQQVLHVLREQCHVCWGVQTLRKVTRAVAEGIAPCQHAARVELVLAWLKQAAASAGRGRCTLAVGRDGLMLPIRGKSIYKEAAAATVSVLDRWGKRLGTIYLGAMPEPGQGTMDSELTLLLREVFERWTGAMPRLAYITDAGSHPRRYFETVLSCMSDPRRPGRYLRWEWIVDYYHACQYVSKLGEAIFGPGRDAHAWAAKMRRWLKEKPGGIYRVLRSAGALRSLRDLVGDAKDYDDGYNYLRKHSRWMDYAGRRRLRMPIGSGVTEAACKTVFTQRFKCSGMKWGIESGAVILALRVAVLGKTWERVVHGMLASSPIPTPPTPGRNTPISLAIAA